MNFRALRLSGAFAILAFALLCAPPALAQQAALGAGHVGPDVELANCAHDPGALTCTIETLLTCLARGDDTLCRRLGAGLPARGADDGLQQADFTIERISVIKPEDIDDTTRDIEWYRPGYTMVELKRRSCAVTEQSCVGAGWEDMQVYLRRDEGGPWRIAAWRGDSQENVAPDVPEDFSAP